MLRLRHASSRRLSVAACVHALLSTTTSGGEAAEPVQPPSHVDPPSAVPANDSVDPQHRVVLLLRTPGDDEAMSRLRVELGDGGFRILEIRADERSELGPLGDAAEREHVAAAVRVDAARRAVELWVQRPEGAVTETFTAGSERSSGHVLAVRVAEALRARGLLLPPANGQGLGEAANRAREDDPRPLEAALPRATQDDELPRPTQQPAPGESAPRRAVRFSVELGPGLELSPGGMGPLAVIELGVRLELRERWSLCAIGTIPVSRQTVRGAEGEADVSTFLVGGLLELEWARLSFGGFRSGLGAGASITSMSGRGAAGFQGQDDHVTAFAPLARTSLHANLGAHLRLRAAVAAGATFPTVSIAFSEHEVATWGRPFFLGSLALEAGSL